MTRRTLSSHGYTLNHIAFRAGIGLPKIAFATFSRPKLVAKFPAKNGQMPQLSANVAQPQHLGSIFAGLASRFPHRSDPDPAASS
jgi:hypothetical protein